MCLIGVAFCHTRIKQTKINIEYLLPPLIDINTKGLHIGGGGGGQSKSK